MDIEEIRNKIDKKVCEDGVAVVMTAFIGVACDDIAMDGELVRLKLGGVTVGYLRDIKYIEEVL